MFSVLSNMISLATTILFSHPLFTIFTQSRFLGLITCVAYHSDAHGGRASAGALFDSQQPYCAKFKVAGSNLSVKENILIGARSCSSHIHFPECCVSRADCFCLQPLV
jgi:hypothetical protein